MKFKILESLKSVTASVREVVLDMARADDLINAKLFGSIF